MDIRKLQPEAEVSYELEVTGPPVTVKFKVGFISLDGIPDYVSESQEGKATGARLKVSDILRRAVSDAVHGWDLTDGDAPLPCTKENKDKYLPLLFGARIKKPKAEGEAEDEAKSVNPVDTVLVMALAAFAGTLENFLKN